MSLKRGGGGGGFGGQGATATASADARVELLVCGVVYDRGTKWFEKAFPIDVENCV